MSTCSTTELQLLVTVEPECGLSASSLGICNLYRDILPSSDNSKLEATEKGCLINRDPL